jgi:hypothetical protein
LRTPFYGAAARLRFHAAKTRTGHWLRALFAAQQILAARHVLNILRL